MAIVWLNGDLLDESDAVLPIRDTGMLHAAGVFTTMRSYNGVVFRLADHLRRIRTSCEALSIPLQYSDDDLVVRIYDNGPDPDPDAGSGHGLTGMLERAAMVGGRVTAGVAPPHAAVKSIV